METMFSRYLLAAVVFASCAILPFCAGRDLPIWTIKQNVAAASVWKVVARCARGASPGVCRQPHGNLTHSGPRPVNIWPRNRRSLNSWLS
jgi:hypothetical protein